MKHIVPALLVVLLLTFAFAAPALAMGMVQTEAPPLELPTEVIGFVLGALTLLSSYITYYLTEAAKKWAPGLAGTVTQVVAAVIAVLTALLFQVVAFVNTWLAGIADPMLIMGIKALFVALVWIISQGIFRSEKAKRSPKPEDKQIDLPLERFTKA